MLFPVERYGLPRPFIVASPAALAWLRRKFPARAAAEVLGIPFDLGALPVFEARWLEERVGYFVDERDRPHRFKVPAY